METPEEDGQEQQHRPFGRACDRCRQRKIRCDRKAPCATCITAGITCVTEESRPQNPRQRVLISREYEKKIEDIGHRLDNIENVLLRLTSNLEGTATIKPDDTQQPSPRTLPAQINSSHRSSRSHTVTSSSNSHSNSSRDYLSPQQHASARQTDHTGTSPCGYDQSVPTSVGGLNHIVSDSSLLAHSQHARKVLEERLRSQPSVINDPEVLAATKQLYAIVHGDGQHRERQAQQQAQDMQTQDNRSQGELPLPPLAVVMRAMNEAQAGDALFFMIWSPFFSADEFRAMVNRLYENPYESDLPRRTLLYGCLFYMFVEWLSPQQLTLEVGMLWAHANTFKRNFEFCLCEQRVLSVAANFDTIIVLVFGAGHAIQQGNFANAWACNTLASRLCQSLSWHRADSYKNTSHNNAQQMKMLFWVIYYIDHSLSLRLGRSSTVQDFDITVTMPEEPVDRSFAAWSVWFRTTIYIARLHGIIYERLYSPQSYTRTAAQRVETAKELAAELHRVAIDNTNTPVNTLHRKQDYMNFLVRSNGIVIGCLMTLTYKAAPRQQPGSQDVLVDEDCLAAARWTIDSHLEIVTVSSGQQNSDYVHWRLLNCPFTPFLVLFTHIIDTGSQKDIELLGRFVQSLEAFKKSSPQAEIFLTLCKAFYTLAERYAKAKRRGSEDLTAMSDWPQAGIVGSTTHSDFHIDPAITFLPPELDIWLTGTQDIDLFDWLEPVTLPT